MRKVRRRKGRGVAELDAFRSVRSKRASGKVESSRYSREEKGKVGRESATELASLHSIKY